MIRSTAYFKNRFKTNYLLTEADYGDLLDSLVNVDDVRIGGLAQYDVNKVYSAGITAIYNGNIVEAIQTTQGTFNPAHWICYNISDVVTFTTVSYAIVFPVKMAAAPTKIILSFVDSEGKVCIGSYDPDSVTEEGLEVSFEGNEGKTIKCTYICGI